MLTGHVDPEVALVDLEATVSSIDNSRLLVTPKTNDIVNSELLKDLLKSKQTSASSSGLNHLNHDQISVASSQDSLQRNRRSSSAHHLPSHVINTL